MATQKIRTRTLIDEVTQGPSRDLLLRAVINIFMNEGPVILRFGNALREFPVRITSIETRGSGIHIAVNIQGELDYRWCHPFDRFLSGKPVWIDDYSPYTRRARSAKTTCS